MTEYRTDSGGMATTLQLESMGMSFPVDISNFGGIVKEIRRVSDPDKAQIIWDGIKTVRAQKQIPALPRLSRYMYRNYKLDKETTQRLLVLAVDDNLIKLHKKIGTKGNKAGVEEDAYRLPTEDMLPFEQHDWYCFHCHSGGEVVLCRDCHRVYHQGCLKEDIMEHISFVCTYCRSFQSVAPQCNDEVKKDLNHLLSIVTNRCRELLPGPILARAPPPPAKNPYLTSDRKATIGEGGIVNSADREAFASFGEEKWRSKFLLKRHIDLDEIMSRCDTLQYRSIEEFRADCQNIVHNVVIYHGNHSNMADMAKQMFRACSTDLNEMMTCKDCFRFAHNRGDKYWFAKPCRPAHQIVYAQQSGYPYWPAKVLGNFTDAQKMVDVRFFGGYHQRAKVETIHIKPISTNVHSLNVTKTSAWNKASEELARYQELYEKCCKTVNFFNNYCGDPFEGEKASLLLGNKFGQGLDEESDDDCMDDGGGQPGEPGTSLPQQEYNTPPQARSISMPMINPNTVIPSRAQLTPNRSMPPTKLRRIEPKPLDNTAHQPQHTQVTLQAAQNQQQQQTLMLPLTVLTVPPPGSVAQHIQPHSIHIQGTTTHINAQQLAAAAAAQSHHQLPQVPTPGPLQLPPQAPTPQPIQLPSAPSTPHPQAMSTPQHITQYPSMPAISSHHQNQPQIQMQGLSSPHPGQATPQHQTPVSSQSFIHFDTTSLSHEDLLSLHSTPVSIQQLHQHQLQAPPLTPHHAIQQQHIINQSFQPQALPTSISQLQPQQNPIPMQVQQTTSHMPTIPQDTLSHLLSPPPPPIPTSAPLLFPPPLPPLAPTTTSTHVNNKSSSTATAVASIGTGASKNDPLGLQQLQLQPPQQQLQTTQQQQTAGGMEVKVKEEIITEDPDDAVSSSSNLTRFVSVSVQTPNKLLRMVAEEICGQSRGKTTEKDYKEFAEKLRAEFDQEKKRAVNVATRSLECDLKRLKADHATEVEALADKAKAELTESKRKQWCFNCEAEAIYWCCWNTAYCSTECQQTHWHREHKRICRRKR